MLMIKRGQRLVSVEREGGPSRAIGSMHDCCGERISAWRYGRGQSDTRSDTVSSVVKLSGWLRLLIGSGDCSLTGGVFVAIYGRHCVPCPAVKFSAGGLFVRPSPLFEEYCRRSQL